MNILVNGKPETMDNGSTIKSVLDAKDLDPALVSVEHNGKILDRSDLEGTVLGEGDELEILFFMGGGRS